ncbi:low temperature requirement protein A [Agromyces sp. H66]|uniref:low temperature requirement protein A n=1 Tax=Agromyces sp. H66 TaxID=2529859 RepID=UPI0010AA3727|nr:low temperature requirement protein A [Agromyces sp. H66]
MPGSNGRTARSILGAVSSEAGHRVTTLELFFDLAYVFAFTQLSRLMAHEHSALGVLQALVILALLWWSWAAYSWLSNLAHADAGIVRVAMIVAMTAMLAMLVVGVVVLEAYHDRPGGLFGPMVFVGAYLVVRITHAIVFVVLEDDRRLRRRALLTVTLSVTASGTLLITGALLGEPWQIWFALAAVAIEPIVAYRTTANVEWTLPSIPHLTERHGLIVILALGESIIAIGVGVAAEPVDVTILIGVVMATLITVAMWWAYFSRLAHPAEEALARRDGGELARAANDAYTHLHLPIVAGIVLAALGLEGAMAHIADTEPFGIFGAAALGGGIACFVTGTGFFALRVLGERRIPRFLGATAFLVLVPLLAAVPPLAALAVVLGLLIVILAVESARATTPPAAPDVSSEHHEIGCRRRGGGAVSRGRRPGSAGATGQLGATGNA